MASASSTQVSAAVRRGRPRRARGLPPPAQTAPSAARIAGGRARRRDARGRGARGHSLPCLALHAVRNRASARCTRLRKVAPPAARPRRAPRWSLHRAAGAFPSQPARLRAVRDRSPPLPELRRVHLLRDGAGGFLAPLPFPPDRAALPGGDSQRPGERIALPIVFDGAGEHTQQRVLRGVLSVRGAHIPDGERPERRPEQREGAAERGSVSVRKPLHQAPQLRALATLHLGCYLLLSGQSSHGMGQWSPHGSLHPEPDPATRAPATPARR